MLSSRRNGELRIRSNAKLSDAIKQAGEANERAAEATKKAEEEQHAQVKLEAKLAPRHITAEQEEILSRELKGKIEPIYIHSLSSTEPWQYAYELFCAFSHIGLVENDGALTGLFKSQFPVGMVGVHVFIWSNDMGMSLDEAARVMDSDPLVTALRLAGIKVERIDIGNRLSIGSIYRPHWKDGRRVLIVAEKPLPSE